MAYHDVSDLERIVIAEMRRVVFHLTITERKIRRKRQSEDGGGGRDAGRQGIRKRTVLSKAPPMPMMTRDRMNVMTFVTMIAMPTGPISTTRRCVPPVLLHV